MWLVLKIVSGGVNSTMNRDNTVRPYPRDTSYSFVYLNGELWEISFS